MNVGDSVGIIQKASKDGKESWQLTEDIITKVAVTKKYGKRYYAKKFHTLNADDVDSSSRFMEDAIGRGYIFVGEVFRLNEKTRPYVERWINWANSNMDKVVDVFEDEYLSEVEDETNIV